MSSIESPKTKFIPVSSKPHPYWDGSQHRYRFPNGRGASVIRSNHSYGGKQGLWEAAVLDANNDLDYSTPVTSDVEGYLSDAEVEEFLQKVKDLPA